MYPKMIVYNVTQELEDEELANYITAQNGIGEEGEVKILFKMKANRGNNILFSCHHSAFNKLLKTGRVCINWERHNVREFLRPIQCFKCFNFGHLAKNCRRQAICSNCGSNEHKNDVCTSETKCVNCVLNNTRFGTKFNTEHHVGDRECCVYIMEINQLRPRIDYGLE